MSEIEENINLEEIASKSATFNYYYHLSLVEFNGKCRIHYSTNSPLLCSGAVILVTTDGPKFVTHQYVKPEGGYFDTGEPWGSGWYAQWNARDANGNWVRIAATGSTQQ